MDIKTIDEYILMEMAEESPEVSMRATKCATTEEYVVKKLVEMEERVYNLKDENETLKKENAALREALKNCGRKITKVAKVLENNAKLNLGLGPEASAISVKVDFDDDDDYFDFDFDSDSDKYEDNDDYDYSDYDDYDYDAYNDNLNYED